jgi:hypothetical protein
MYLAELVEMAIGLVVVFFLVSMASSQILEWASQFLRWRSHDLESAIRGMILNQPVEPSMFSGLTSQIQRLYRRVTRKAPPDEIKGEWIIKQLYEHPLIKPLSKAGMKPSNIPTRSFALALFDTVMTAGTASSRIQAALAVAQDQANNLPGLEQEIQSALAELIRLTGEAVQSSDPIKLGALKQELDQFEKDHPPAKPVLDALLSLCTSTVFDQIKDGLVKLATTNPDLKRTLESLISQVALDVKTGETEIAAARANVETWFDTTMDQLTTLYRNRSKLWAGVVALGLAAVLNIDTLSIATTLWKEPTLRQSVVAYAEKLQPPPASTLDLSQAATPAPAVSSTAALTSTQAIPPAETVDYLNQYLVGLQLPVGGWTTETSKIEQASCAGIQNQPTWAWYIWWNNACQVWTLKDLQSGWSGLLAKLAGWAITALAAAQGAPFWFDILTNLLQLSGKKKPEETAAAAK